MLTEDGALAEGLPTDVAHVGLLPGVDSLVLKQMGAPTKALPTLDAHVGSLSTGSHLVSSKWHARVQYLHVLGANGVWTRAEVLLCFVMLFMSLLQRYFRRNHCFFV